MKAKLSAIIAILLTLGIPGVAHRLDEYLQATIVSIEKDRIQAVLRLIPGVAVSSSVLAGIDTNADGVLSENEHRAYAEQVLRDLSLTVDGHPLELRLVSATFPKTEEMKQGVGEIQIEFYAHLPHGEPRRKLVLENHHQSRIAAYLVNCLVPRDPGIRVIAQTRNENQSYYALEYVQGAGGPAASLNVPPSTWRSGAMSGAFGGIPSMFRLGMRHIAEGTDHLMFLLVLLLPAPLLALGSQWAGFAGSRRSLAQILKVVSAFTAGHSITLALAGLGVVHIPSRTIEILIAVSILVSAFHAIRPVFPGREAAIAAFFGLLHGLAFAATLGQLGLARWERLVNILAFNLGIETMQLVVVGAIMPSLVLLSLTRAYAFFRVGGALFAAIASVGWIAERLLHLPSSVDVMVAGIARRPAWIAGLLLIGILCWALHHLFDNSARAVHG
jgi:hypothetical protein